MVGDVLGDVIHQNSDDIVAKLTGRLRGPYTFVNAPHEWDACPFNAGPLPITRMRVSGEYELPAPPVVISSA